MRRAFEKYEGLGNDFIVVDAAQWSADVLRDGLARALCDRHTGVGADGVLWVSRDPSPRMIVFNADGSRPEMCGNGARCVAAWLASHDRAFTVLDTDAGPRPVRVLSSRDGAFTIEVDMGRARVLDPSPVRVDTNAGRFEVWNVRVGNPHAVLFLERALDTATAEHVAARVRAHTEHWPEGANVEFVTRGPSGFQVQVHERGVGWTRACGTGACAVAWAAVRAGLAEAGKGALAVHLQGGALSITCDPVSAHEAQVTMSGPARRVFTGEIEIEGETEAAS